MIGPLVAGRFLVAGRSDRLALRLRPDGGTEAVPVRPSSVVDERAAAGEGPVRVRWAVVAAAALAAAGVIAGIGAAPKLMLSKVASPQAAVC